MLKPNRGGLPVLVLVAASMGLAETEWNSHFREGMEHYRSGRMEAAKKSWTAAVGAVHDLPPSDPRVAQIWNNLAAAQSATGDLAAAENAYQSALACWQGRAPGLEYAKTLNNLASLHRITGRAAQAADEALEAWRVAGASAPDATTRFHILFNRAEIARTLGLAAQAEALAAELEEEAGKTGEPRRAAQALQLRAGLRAAAYDWPAAERLQREALNRFADALPTGHPTQIEATAVFGQILLGGGKFEEARAYLDEALAQSESVLGPKHPQVAAAVFNIARWKWERGERQGIEPLLRRALDIWTAAYGSDHPLVSAAWRQLALLFQAQGKASGAEQLFQRALRTAERSLGSEHKQTREILGDLVSLYESQRRSTAAARVRERLGLLPTN
jgi:tetratricopeptide (TPR) repeat protein